MSSNNNNQNGLICNLYTYDGINYESKPFQNNNDKYKLKLDKVDKNTNKYLCFNYNEDNNEDKCLSFWSGVRNEWADHPPDQKRYKKRPYNFISYNQYDNNYPMDNQPFTIEYYSIHCNAPFDLVLYDERFRIENDDEIVASA